MRHLAVLLLCCLVSLPAAALHMRVEGEALRLSGPVEADDCARLKGALAARPLRVVVLGDSGGGDSEAGYCMGAFLRAQRIETVIRGRCVSACSRIWLGGVRRRLEGPESRVGLHGNYDEDGVLVPAAMARLRAWLPRYAPVDAALMERWIGLPTNRWMMYFYNDRAEVCEGRVCTPLPGWDAARAGLLG
jgi:hypothetical protein